jgi:hypothetical protein
MRKKGPLKGVLRGSHTICGIFGHVNMECHPLRPGVFIAGAATLLALIVENFVEED